MCGPDVDPLSFSRLGPALPTISLQTCGGQPRWVSDCRLLLRFPASIALQVCRPFREIVSGLRHLRIDASHIRRMLERTSVLLPYVQHIVKYLIISPGISQYRCPRCVKQAIETSVVKGRHSPCCDQPC